MGPGSGFVCVDPDAPCVNDDDITVDMLEACYWVGVVGKPVFASSPSFRIPCLIFLNPDSPKTGFERRLSLPWVRWASVRGFVEAPRDCWSVTPVGTPGC